MSRTEEPFSRISLAGVPFAVGPEDCLSPSERALLSGLGVAERENAAPDPFVLRLTDELAWEGARLEDFQDKAPGRVTVVGDRVRLAHRRYLAEIQPVERLGLLYRRDCNGGALAIALRVALSARLPLEGGLPLHAAGIVAQGEGLAFFGPSGAGKSTLAATSPWPVLSDELVVATGRPFRLLGAGFWGTFEGGEKPQGGLLRALVELEKGPRFRLTRLSRRAAVRRLLGVMLVPPQASLWREALRVLANVVDSVPVFRMAWSPAEPPWAALGAGLLNIETRTCGGCP